ncbi:MAG: HAMP domain-containing protein, partial [Anaerolineae bacterium]|nr:HAMP domain-containing protein [Anaerolineae bacterium]
MKQSPPPITPKHHPLRRILASISTKIIVPYLLLTLIVAGVGAFVVVRLVTGSLQERFNNQLLDAGRVVSEGVVDYEKERLNVLRAVAGTEGVAQGLEDGNRSVLAGRVPQIIANSNTDAVELLNQQGLEIYGWQRPPHQTGNIGDERSGADFSEIVEVRRVLDGVIDEFGEKRVFLSETPYGLMIFTIGPVFINEEQVGAVLVGTYLNEMVTELSRIAAARVTFYTPQGVALDTGLGGDQEGIIQRLREPPEQYQAIIDSLREEPNRYPVILNRAENQVPLDQVTVLGQDYSLAYGDWRLRNQSVGFFSVALPNNFIVTKAATSRNWFSLIFSGATMAVLVVGFFIARRIIMPLNQLVQTSAAVAQGQLDQRTGIRRNDEIGSLAQSFDLMTERLEARNRELVEQASKLEVILDSTADGMIVLDRQGLILTANPAAKRLLVDISTDFLAEILRELPAFYLTSPQESSLDLTQALAEAHLKRPKRYHIGSRVFSIVLAPMRTPAGEQLGTVIALRDVTREVEAEQLKDGFITTVSHQLRTPLTAIKGFSELLLLKSDNLTESQH